MNRYNDDTPNFGVFFYIVIRIVVINITTIIIIINIIIIDKIDDEVYTWHIIDLNDMEVIFMLEYLKLGQIDDVLLSLTEFRKNLSTIIDQLSSAKILMKNEKPKAVIMPYEMYKAMEEELEAYHDSELIHLANERLKDDSKRLSSSDMRKWASTLEE